MSTKMLPTARGDAGFDYGAQYMSARDPAFRARVARWRDAGVVAAWPAAGPDAWVGMPGMSAPVIDMAGRCDVRWSSRVAALLQADRRWRLCGERLESEPYDAVVVAIPAEQAARLVGDRDVDMAALAAATPSQPCWTLMAAFAEALPIAADVIKDGGVVAWAARNSAKPGRLYNRRSEIVWSIVTLRRLASRTAPCFELSRAQVVVLGRRKHMIIGQLGRERDAGASVRLAPDEILDPEVPLGRW